MVVPVPTQLQWLVVEYKGVEIIYVWSIFRRR